jgi:hypothetical protein
MDAKSQAEWCRRTRKAVALMSGAELAVVLADTQAYSATSPTYALVYRMAKNETKTRESR